ncbi:MAG: diguanylate cyclase, partial [Leptospiraceae bacterium]|nr:diguanylate cyclase [Leptospiraceae bacterium]
MTEQGILPIVHGCALVGVLFLVLGIINGIRILKLLHYNRRWVLLVALMVFFIIGYIGYVIILHVGIQFEVHLLISMVFLVGAVFVFLIVLTSLRTVADIKRVSLFKELAATDSLTFLYNRRVIDERLDDEIRRAIRYQRPLSIMMIDIDHFKNVNDSLGHQCGDAVLVSLARLLCLNLRHIDIVGRYGGEEFLVILPETSAEMALPVAERLRQSVVRARFRCAHTGEHKNLFRHLLEHKAVGQHEQAGHGTHTPNAHGHST